MAESQLIGYVRKSNNGGALKFSIDTKAFEDAQRFSTKDGREYVQLIANIPKVREIISGEREVTSMCQIIES